MNRPGTATVIRLATAHDAAAIAEIYRPIVESTAISFESIAPDANGMRQRIEDTLESHPWLVCDRGGLVIGYAYASKHRTRAAYQWSVDTSVYIAAHFRQRGIGRGLYLSLLAVLSEQGYANAFAGIALPNAASVALHERVGFTPVGVYRRVGYKLGEWHDVGWWQRPLERADEEPLPIRDLSDLQHGRELEALLATGVADIRDEG